MAEFVVCYATYDNVHANLHAYCRGEGSIRDENHVRDIVDEFCKGNEGKINTSPPSEGERTMFEITLGVKDTRKDHSTYFGCDYSQIQQCPHCVAEARMDIFLHIKSLLMRAARRKDK